jgi:uncharacterized protein (DUF1697 family)
MTPAPSPTAAARRYAALLRGTNVGGNKKLAMSELRELLEAIGCTEVRTYLQSGNAAFVSSNADSQEVARQIEQAIQDRLGMSLRCLTRTALELETVIADNPLSDVATDGGRMLALFLSAPLGQDHLAVFDPTSLDPETIRLGDRVIYQWCPDGIMAAPAPGPLLEKRTGIAVTARNWNTVTKLRELLSG